MTREDLIDFCLMFTASYEDYPFDDIADSGAWTVMRHRANKKSFALIYERNGKLYHMNKTHWNTVTIGGDVPETEIKRMVGNSYDLIKPKVRARKRI